MATITLKDGRTLDIRTPMYLSEKNAVVAFQERLAEANREKTGYLDAFSDLGAVIRPAVSATSWGGDVLDMDEPTLLGLIGQWASATDDPGRTD